MTFATKTFSRRKGEPAWEIASLFPAQGAWDEDEYLDLDGNRLIEFTDGVIEVLPMPTISHQLISQFIFLALHAFVTKQKMGQVFYAPLPVRLRKGMYREPDILFVKEEHVHWLEDRYCDSADLVIEVISDDWESRDRDLKKKRRAYARAGITEYWIVDPKLKTITVLKLSGRRYVEHGVYSTGERARSLVVRGFGVEVGDVMKAGRRK